MWWWTRQKSSHNYFNKTRRFRCRRERPRSCRRQSSLRAGGPLKPGFGLSGDCSDLPNSVIPTGTDHRKAMICGVEGPAVFWGEGRVEIESEWTKRKRRTIGASTLSGCRTPPLKPKPGLNGPPVQQYLLKRNEVTHVHTDTC
jgi:hypothetical protein